MEVIGESQFITKFLNSYNKRILETVLCLLSNGDKMKIFVSSTYEDLIDERSNAITTIDRTEQAIAMEKWFAEDKGSKEVALNKLQECDAAVLILGFRYGSVNEEEELSITEIEYNTAKSLGLPIFVFLKSDSKGKW